jgi:inward rectifier potassium channel
MARDLGQTRVFGQAGHDTVVVGLRRRLLSDLYHRLVTGGWLQLCLVYGLVYFLTGAVLEVAHWAVADAGSVAPGSLMGAAVALFHGTSTDEALAAIDPRALAAGALTAVDGFVRWTELVIGAGIVMAKFSTQKALVLFSEEAVVAPHDRGQALLFRMANQRRGHVVDARVSLLLVRNEREPDGEVVRRAHDLPLLRGGTALFEHAWTAVHEMDRASPLWGETAESLAAAQADLLVTFSGYDERLLRPLHARHVYAARRVQWGARFASIDTVLPDGRRALDYRRFHEVVPAEDTDTEADRPRRERAS